MEYNVTNFEQIAYTVLIYIVWLWMWPLGTFRKLTRKAGALIYVATISINALW